jgi:hypothetical protein
MLLPCVRPDQVSVAPVAARWLDRGQDVEVQIGDRLERLRGRRAAQRLRQGVEPRGITGLQVDQFGDGIVPMLEAAPAVNRAARADNDGGLLLLVARSIDLMSVSGPGNPGREVRPGLRPGPAKGGALGTSLSVFAASA